MRTLQRMGSWARGIIPIAAVALAFLLSAPSRGHAVPVPCCDQPMCQLVEQINCNHPEPGTACDNVACSGCCQGLTGNPALCSSEFGKVACLQGNGNFTAHAHCDAGNTACLPGSLNGVACTDNTQCASGFCLSGVCVDPAPAPALSARTMMFVAAGLLLAGLWSVRRLARR